MPTKPTPSNEQGFGFPVLADALYFPGDAVKLRVSDVPLQSGLIEGQTVTTQVVVRGANPLKVVLVWTDPAGTSLVNDLDLRVTDPAGATFFGNGQADHVNNVEAVSIAQPLERHLHHLRSPPIASVPVRVRVTRSSSPVTWLTPRVAREPRGTDRYNPPSMLSREYLREHADDYRTALKNRGAKVDIDRFLELDAERRRTIARVETLKNQRNVASQEIAALKKNKQDATARRSTR